MFVFKPSELMSFSRSGRDRKFKCCFCNYTSTNKVSIGQHYDVKHRDEIPSDSDGYRYFYYTLTGKEHGSCIICDGDTEFNRNTMKYSRFCQNPECKQKYRDEFKNRMISKYGRVNLLNDPDMQKKMLAGRSISGEYTWSDGSTTLGYTGTYELDFLKLMDTRLKWKSSDIMEPSPHVYEYEYKDAKHFYIPDFYVPSLNLEVEVKDGGQAKNINPDSREKDKIKDELMRSNANFFNYIRIEGKNYGEFFKLLNIEQQYI